MYKEVIEKALSIKIRFHFCSIFQVWEIKVRKGEVRKEEAKKNRRVLNASLKNQSFSFILQSTDCPSLCIAAKGEEEEEEAF